MKRKQKCSECEGELLPAERGPNCLYCRMGHQRPTSNENGPVNGVGISLSRLRGVSVRTIVRVVAEEFHVGAEEILGRGKLYPNVEARRITLYLVRRLTGRSSPEVGKMLGGRHHSTVLRVTKFLERELESNFWLRANLQRIVRRLECESSKETTM